MTCSVSCRACQAIEVKFQCVDVNQLGNRLPRWPYPTAPAVSEQLEVYYMFCALEEAIKSRMQLLIFQFSLW